MDVLGGASSRFAFYSLGFAGVLVPLSIYTLHEPSLLTMVHVIESVRSRLKIANQDQQTQHNNAQGVLAESETPPSGAATYQVHHDKMMEIKRISRKMAPNLQWNSRKKKCIPTFSFSTHRNRARSQNVQPIREPWQWRPPKSAPPSPAL